jgi:pre-mRNA-splicing factor CWC26
MASFVVRQDDPELNLLLKEKLRWGDPMASFVVRQVDQKKIGFDSPPNRYGIKPGQHWVGVDRSNGFEKQLVKKLNERQDQDKVVYLSAVSHL